MCKNREAKERILKDIAPLIYRRKFNPEKLQTEYQVNRYENRTNRFQLQ